MFSGGPLLAAEVTATDSMAQAGHLRTILGKKPGRGFCHKETRLYISDSGTFEKQMQNTTNDKNMLHHYPQLAEDNVASDGWRCSDLGDSTFSCFEKVEQAYVQKLKAGLFNDKSRRVEEARA